MIWISVFLGFCFLPNDWRMLSFYTGGVGIADMIEKIKNNEYMGFEDICTWQYFFSSEL